MITLGLVADVDADGIYVTLPGSRGLLRGPFETLQNVVAGDKVLVVTTDDGDCVVVGLAAASAPAVVVPDGSITSAKIANGTIVDEDISASAAIDKTKVSGTAITAADTGTVTNAMLAGSIAASKITGLPTSSTDNTLPRFDSTGGALQTSGIVVDDNNRLRVASGSSGGLEIGSSGVLNMSGTGGPSGISAPVGSTWRQTDANASHGSLTGLLWNKVGTGTTEGTDWLVDYEGRWIDWTPTLTNITRGTGYSQRNKFTRSGKSITFDFALHFGTGGSVTADPSITLPVSAVATQEHLFPALLRTTSTYSLGIGYYITGALTFFAVGTAGSLLGDIASVTTLAGSWASTGRIQVNGTYEIA